MSRPHPIPPDHWDRWALERSRRLVAEMEQVNHPRAQLVARVHCLLVEAMQFAAPEALAAAPAAQAQPAGPADMAVYNAIAENYTAAPAAQPDINAELLTAAQRAQSCIEEYRLHGEVTDYVATGELLARAISKALAATGAQPVLPDIETVSAAVHEAWMQSKRAQGVTSRKSESGEELMVPYAQLSEDAKDLDRGTVRAVYAAIERCNMRET